MTKQLYLMDELSLDQLTSLRAELRMIASEWRMCMARMNRTSQRCSEVHFRLDPLSREAEKHALASQALVEQVDRMINEKARQP